MRLPVGRFAQPRLGQNLVWRQHETEDRSDASRQELFAQWSFLEHGLQCLGALDGRSVESREGHDRIQRQNISVVRRAE